MARQWLRSDVLALASVVVSLVAIGVTVAPYGYRLLTRTTATIEQPADHLITRTILNASGASGHERRRPRSSTMPV